MRKEAREKRNEKVRADAETRAAENKYQEALDEIADLKAQLTAETRNKELAERDGVNYSQTIRELRAENGRLREELGRAKVEADNAKSKLESVENAQRASEEQRARDEATVAWIGDHRDVLLIGGVVVGLVLLWIADLSWAGLLLVLGLVAAFEVVVYRIAARPAAPPPAS